jgi:hypothetical protein
MNQKLFIPLVLFLVFTCIRAGAEVPTQGVSASEVVIGAHISASGRSALKLSQRTLKTSIRLAALRAEKLNGFPLILRPSIRRPLKPRIH